jgi:hypothetical protein
MHTFDHHHTMLWVVLHNTVLPTVLSGIQNTVPDDLFVTRATVVVSI